jgi:hypothetical protein
MFKILYSNGCREELTAASADSIGVRAYTPDGQHVFSFAASADNAAARLSGITGKLRSAAASASQAVEPEGLRLDATSPSDQKKLVIEADEFEDSELPELDKSARLTQQTMRHWIEAAEARQAVKQFETAFQCGAAALERGHMPYIELPVKDDTGQRRRAAQSTFEGGRQEQAVAMILQLSKGFLKLVDEHWK